METQSYNTCTFLSHTILIVILQQKTRVMEIFVFFGLVPPEKVTITGGENAMAGDTITLSCTTSNSHPRAMITWYAKGVMLDVPDGATTVSSLPPALPVCNKHGDHKSIPFTAHTCYH